MSFNETIAFGLALAGFVIWYRRRLNLASPAVPTSLDTLQHEKAVYYGRCVNNQDESACLAFHDKYDNNHLLTDEY